MIFGFVNAVAFKRFAKITQETSTCTSVNTLIIKITISSNVIGLKNSYFPTNSLAKLLSDSLLLDSLLSDSSISQSHSKL